ncbi:MAG: helix-turn-helix domain-containing protein [Pseudonocardiaceae bacterium]
MDAEEARTIGWALWRVRDDRGKSLRVIAGLAGMGKDTLNRIERGERSPTLSEIGALADALQVSVSELTRLPVPAPANGHTDSTIAAVDLALMAVSHDLPDGQVLPVEALRARVAAMVDALCHCEREREVGTALPGLIQDLHSSIAAGRDVSELLQLSAWLHTQATVPWLSVSAAAVDLRGQAVMLARQAAHEHGTAVPMGLVAAAGARVALAKGAFGIAQAGLDAVTVPTNTPETMQLAGFLALRRSVVAAADRRRGDVDAPLEYAAELAARTGEGNAYGLGFGPINVDLYRISGLLEVGDHERVVSIAEGMNPQAHINRSRRVAYWADYGQALARLRGRHEDAVRALRRAELISPHRIQRNPIIRDVLAVLLRHSRRGSPTDQELRGMARRAGLPV